MFEFLKQIADILVSIGSFIVNLVLMLVYALTMIPDLIYYLTSSIGFLPTFVGSFVIIFISISLLFTLLNHWGN